MTTDYITLYEDLKDLHTALERAKDAADCCGVDGMDISSALSDLLYEVSASIASTKKYAAEQEEQEEARLRSQYYKDLL